MDCIILNVNVAEVAVAIRVGYATILQNPPEIRTEPNDVALARYFADLNGVSAEIRE